MYMQNKYEDVNPEQEIKRLKKEIQELEKSNSEKINILAAGHHKELDE